MLPDFPKSRKELSERLRLHLRMRVQDKSPFAALVNQFTQHEGTTFSYEQILGNDTRIVEEDFEEISVPIRVEIKEIPYLAGDKLFAKLDSLADDMARQTSQLGFSKLDEVTRIAGTSINAHGKPFTQELFIELEEAHECDFDPVTKAPEGVYLAHPDTAEWMHKLWQEWEKDKAFMERIADIRARKYEEWRDRESRRKLVS